ncbi:unnamed protein product, partial [Urochloa humidicola]
CQIRRGASRCGRLPPDPVARERGSPGARHNQRGSGRLGPDLPRAGQAGRRSRGRQIRRWVAAEARHGAGARSAGDAALAWVWRKSVGISSTPGNGGTTSVAARQWSSVGAASGSAGSQEATAAPVQAAPDA